MSVMTPDFHRTVPVFRIFDVAKAHEFYLDYLGCTVDWEHRFEPGMPLYTQVSRGDLVLHLSEHHGDATPGSTVYTELSGVRALHAELMRQELPVSAARSGAGRDRDLVHADRSLRQPAALQRTRRRRAAVRRGPGYRDLRLIFMVSMSVAVDRRSR